MYGIDTEWTIKERQTHGGLLQPLSGLNRSVLPREEVPKGRRKSRGVFMVYTTSVISFIITTTSPLKDSRGWRTLIYGQSSKKIT